MVPRFEVREEQRPKNTRTPSSGNRTTIQADRITENTMRTQEGTIPKMKNTDVWISLVEVQPQPGNDTLADAKGAFVNVVALAPSEREYKFLVETTMAEYGFSIIKYADVARLVDWKRTYQLHPELAQLANGLTKEFPIQFDEFQSYLHADEA